jgi:DNA sulfur modification protein DndC
VDAEVVTVTPKPIDSFWVGVLGKGYPAAHMGFRWCTGKLKIDPITKFTKKAVAGKSFTVFVGVRSAESALRARIYKSKDYKLNHFAPILDWTSADVWEHLMSTPSPWSDHSKLIEVYRYSSDECVYGEKEGVCVGNARYGCWACPLQRSGQLNMIGYHTKDDRYQLLREFKETLVGMANNRSLRSVVRRNGAEGAGPFLVKIRQRLLSDLLAIQKKTGWELITEPEIVEIKRHWEIDENVHNVGNKTRPMLWDLCQAN